MEDCLHFDQTTMSKLWHWTREEQVQAGKAHAEFFLQWARTANELYLQGGENVLKGLSSFDRELVHILAGQAWAAANAESIRDAAQLCNDYPSVAAYLMDLRLDAREQMRWLEQAVVAACQLGDKQAEGNNRGTLGLTLYQLGEDSKAIAYYKQALAIALEIADKQSELKWLGSLGIAYGNSGALPEAIRYHEQALMIAREIGDKRSEGNELGNLGLTYFQVGNARKAIEYHQKALEIGAEIGDKRFEGIQFGNLGLSYYQLGKVHKAIEYLEEALSAARAIGDKRSEGNWLGNLGLSYYQLGDVRKALEYDDAAIEILEQIESLGAEPVRTAREIHRIMSRHSLLYTIIRLLFPLTRRLGGRMRVRLQRR